MASFFPVLRKLTDTGLLRRARDLAQQNRGVQVELLAHVAEVDRRKLYLVQGYPSLYRYLCEELRLSEYGAYKHIHSVRAVRQFPVILERLRDGELHLSAVRLLAPRLTEKNCLELLDRAKHKTKRQIEELVADLAPRPDAPDRIRPLPRSAKPAPFADPAAGASPAKSAQGGSTVASAPTRAVTARPPTEPPASPGRRAPLGSGRFKIQFTAGRDFVELLEEVKALLRHRVPDGELRAVFERALRSLREDLKLEKFGKTGRPARRATPPKNRTRSRHVPNAIRRSVAERDGECCAYVSPDGKRCGSRDFLEFEHQDPWAKYSVHRADRIRLFCRPHNQLSAEREFGREFMQQFTRGETAPVKTGPGAS